MPGKLRRLTEKLIIDSAVALARIYLALSKPPRYSLENLSMNLKGSNLMRLFSGEAQALTTVRFIDLLDHFDANVNSPLDVERINGEAIECIRSKIGEHPIHEVKEVCSQLIRSKIPKAEEYVHTLIHEYSHFDMIAGTETAKLAEMFSLRERIDNIAFTDLVYRNINLGEIVGEDFARRDKADVIGSGLEENKAKQILEDEIIPRIENLVKSSEAIRYFASSMNDYKVLSSLSNLIAVVVEPTTWALVENDKYFSMYWRQYFNFIKSKSEEFKCIKEIYQEAKRIGYTEAVNKARWVLQELPSLISKNRRSAEGSCRKCPYALVYRIKKMLQELSSLISKNGRGMDDSLAKGITNFDDLRREIIKEMCRIFKNSPGSIRPAKNYALPQILIELVYEYSKDEYEKKLELMASLLTRDLNVMRYLLNFMRRYKGPLDQSGVPGVCSDFVNLNNELVGGCYNVYAGTVGKEGERRPFGTLEELEGNLALSVKPAMILFVYYSHVKQAMIEKETYKGVADRVSRKLSFVGIKDFENIAVDEALSLDVNPNFNVLSYYTPSECMKNERDCAELMRSFLTFWMYIVLRLGKAIALLPNRHGIYVL